MDDENQSRLELTLRDLKGKPHTFMVKGAAAFVGGLALVFLCLYGAWAIFH